MSDVISVQRLVPAAPEPIFDLLADPAGHAEIDGGGTVKGARSGGRRLALGDRFGMDMHLGVAYSTRNTVIELDENRLIAWQTTASGPLGNVLGGRIWRYELEPVEGGTLVTETWDLSQEKWTSKPRGQGDHVGLHPHEHGAHPRPHRGAGRHGRRRRRLAPRGQLALLRHTGHRPAHRAGADVPRATGQRRDRPAGGQPQRPARPAGEQGHPARGDQPVARAGPPRAAAGRAAGTGRPPGPRRWPRARAGRPSARRRARRPSPAGRWPRAGRATRADCAT